MVAAFVARTQQYRAQYAIARFPVAGIIIAATDRGFTRKETSK
jgi:hypothetical protein